MSQNDKVPITTSSEKALELYYQARNFSERVQPLSAIPLYEEALKLDSNFMMAQFGLTNVITQPGPRRDAIKKMFKMFETAKVSTGEKLFFEMLQAGFNSDNITADRKRFELYKLYPNDERIVNSLASYYAGKNDIDKAIELYERAIQINPDYIPVYNTLGYTYRGQGKMDDAERIFKKAIQIDTKNPNSYDSYAELLLKLGRFEESIKFYEKALEIESIFPSAVMGIASNLLHLKRYQESRDRLSKIIEIAPNDGIRGGVHWAISVTYIDEGKFDDAIREMNINYNFSKKHNDYQSMSIDLSNISRIYALKGDYKTALEKSKESEKMMLKVDFTEQQKENIIKSNLYTDATFLVHLGKIKEAETKLKAYEEFVQSQPANRFNTANIHILKSMIAFKEGNYAKTIDELDEDKVFTWSYPNMYRRAQSYQKLGELAEAKKWFNYIVTSRGALNYEYSVLRHKAMEELAAL